MNDILDMAGNRITNVEAPRDPADAATKQYVDTREEWVSDSGDNMTGDLNMTGNRLFKISEISGAFVESGCISGCDTKILISNVLDLQGNGIMDVQYISRDSGTIAMDSLDLTGERIINSDEIRTNKLGTSIYADQHIAVGADLELGGIRAINHSAFYDLDNTQLPSCISSRAGQIRFNNSVHWGCNGTHWNQLY